MVADASALALDDVVDAAFAGRPAEVEAQFAKARAAGTSAGTILFAALRHVTQLHKARRARCRRRILARCRAAAGQFSPQGRRQRRRSNFWSAAKLLVAMSELADAVLQSRRSADLADTIAERALLAIAANVRRNAA